MTTRVSQTVCGLILSLFVGQSLYASDDRSGLDELSATFVRVISSIESQYDCLFRVKSVDIVEDDPSGIQCWARYEAVGDDCFRAGEGLSALGRENGILFSQDKSALSKSTYVVDPNFTLIHKINPPVDE